MNLIAIVIGVVAVVVAFVIVAAVVALPFVMIAAVVGTGRPPRRVVSPPVSPPMVLAPARFTIFTDDDEIQARHHSR